MNNLVIRTNVFTLSIAATAFLLTSSIANAEIYKWRNDRGVIQYSDKPPVDGFTKTNRHELVNSLQVKDLCAAPTAKTVAAASAKNAKNIDVNFFSSALSTGFGALATKPVSTTSFSILGIAAPKTTVAPAPKPVAVVVAPKPTSVVVAPKPTVVATAPTVTPAPAPTPVSTTPVVSAPAPAPAPTTPVVSAPAPTTGPNILQSGLMPAVDINRQATPVVGSSVLQVRTTTEKPRVNTDNTGQFRIMCGYSHMSNDDPIIYPNQQGAAHHHTFFGNTSVNFKTSPSTVSTTGTSTCSGGIMNRSAYWVPSMIDTVTNAPIRPDRMLIYYKTTRPGQVITPPKGLRMIAGNSKSTLPQAEGLVRYTCNEDYNTRKLQIPACTQGQTMETLLHFPSCWDGKNLDSPDHQSHMAYAKAGSCPATHPVQIPDISFNVYYKVNTAGGTAKWRLASDNYAGGIGGNSFHGDWMNGWDETFSAAFTNNCLKKGVDCHAHLIGDGRMYY